MKELFEKGDVVIVDFPPGCDQEFAYHGMQPKIQGRQGYIEGIDMRTRDAHVYRVRFDHHKYYAQWFRADELRLKE